MMSDLDDLHRAEAEREAKEAQARRNWEFLEKQRVEREMRDGDFPDDWLDNLEYHHK